MDRALLRRNKIKREWGSEGEERDRQTKREKIMNYVFCEDDRKFKEKEKSKKKR